MGFTPCVNFINILPETFVLILLNQKITKAKMYLEKSYAKHFCTKILSVKCWWNWLLVTTNNKDSFKNSRIWFWSQIALEKSIRTHTTHVYWTIYYNNYFQNEWNINILSLFLKSCSVSINCCSSSICPCC